VTRRDLGAAALPVEAAETLVERQPHLLAVPAARHASRDRLTAENLDAEALEAKRARPRADRILLAFGAKSVTGLTRTAGGTERRLTIGTCLRPRTLTRTRCVTLGMSIVGSGP
jgi:hypothetical protein